MDVICIYQFYIRNVNLYIIQPLRFVTQERRLDIFAYHLYVL